VRSNRAVFEAYELWSLPPFGFELSSMLGISKAIFKKNLLLIGIQKKISQSLSECKNDGSLTAEKNCL
jgi:hypothetical protein